MLTKLHGHSEAAIHAVAILGALGIAHSALANLVQNNSFEDYSGGALSGWTIARATEDSHVYVSSNGGHTGERYVAFGATGTEDDTVSQDIPVVAGQSYKVGFWLNVVAPDAGTDLVVTLGATTLVHFPSLDPYPDWEYLEYTTVATGNNLTLSIGARDDSGFIYLDDVSVTAVPETSSLVADLFSFGFVILGVLRLEARRRKR